MQETTAGPAHGGTGSVTIADIVSLAAERYGERPAARFKRDDEWREVSYTELGETVSEIARGLVDLGLQQGDRVALLCTTRVEWTYADFAITSAGGVVVPIYPTNSPEECAWVAGNSESRFIVCEDAEQVAKIVAVQSQLPKLEAIVAIEAGLEGTISVDELRERGRIARARRDRGAHRRRPARGPVHDHLHVGDDRPAQGLRADPRQLSLGHAHVRGDQRHRVGRGRLPLPAAGALLRTADPAPGRRPGRADRLLERRPAAGRPGPDGDQAGVPPVGAADLREDLHARHVQQRSGEDQGGDAARAQGPAHARGGAGRAAAAGGGLREGRRRAVRQRPQPVRRQPQAGDVGRRADLDRDPRVLLRLRRARARGLRDDGDLDGLHHLDGRRPPARHRGAGASGRRGQDRRRRRDPRPRPAHLPRLLRQGRHDGLRRGDRRRLAAHG